MDSSVQRVRYGGNKQRIENRVGQGISVLFIRYVSEHGFERRRILGAPGIGSAVNILDEVREKINVSTEK